MQIIANEDKCAEMAVSSFHYQGRDQVQGRLGGRRNKSQVATSRKSQSASSLTVSRRAVLAIVAFTKKRRRKKLNEIQSDRRDLWGAERGRGRSFVSSSLEWKNYKTPESGQIKDFSQSKAATLS